MCTVTYSSISRAFSENEFLVTILLTVTLFIVGVGVFLFVTAGTRWSSMEKLLQEGEYTVREKEKSKLVDGVGGIYWLVVTAIYLAWSFTTNQWEYTWIVWPVAGVIFAVIAVICGLITDKKRAKKDI